MVTAKDLLALADSISADSVSNEADYHRIWQDHIQAEHVVAGRAILERPRPSRILGDAPPQRAHEM